MRTLALVVIAFCSLLFRAEAQESLLTQAKVAFKRDIRGAHFRGDTISFGDLNGDGVTDFVTFVENSESNNNRREPLKVAVFLGKPDNTFRLYEMSSDIFRHDRVTFDLQIKKQSVFLRRSGTFGFTDWVEEFQFKIREGHMRLVGLETGGYHPGDASEDSGVEEDSGVSVNFITGKVIKWHGTGKKKREKEKILPALKPVLFKDFNYETYDDKWGSALE